MLKAGRKRRGIPAKREPRFRGLAGQGGCHCSLTDVLFRDVLFIFQPRNYSARVNHAMTAKPFINIGEIAP